MTVGNSASFLHARPLAAALLVAVACGCGTGGQSLQAPDAVAALTAVAGPLPDGLEVLFFEPRTARGGAWIVRTPARWLPHGETEHRHAILPATRFADLVAATTRGALDLGRPTESTCEFTQWDSMPPGTERRREFRIHQLATEQGEFAMFEVLPDADAGRREQSLEPRAGR